MKGFLKSKKILEYDKIISRVASMAKTAPAKLKIIDTVPNTDPVTVERLLNETEEALDLLILKGFPSFSAPMGVIDSIDRAEKGATLTLGELLGIGSLLRSVINVKKYPEYFLQRVLFHV